MAGGETTKVNDIVLPAPDREGRACCLQVLPGSTQVPMEGELIKMQEALPLFPIHSLTETRHKQRRETNQGRILPVLSPTRVRSLPHPSGVASWHSSLPPVASAPEKVPHRTAHAVDEEEKETLQNNKETAWRRRNKT